MNSSTAKEQPEVRRRLRWPFGVFSSLFLLIVVMTTLELFILVQLTKLTNLWTTFAIIIVSGVVGAYMWKREGLVVIAKLKREVMRGGFPARTLVDGVFVVIGGAFLLTPGLITDLIGFTTLVPACRRFYVHLALKLLRSKAQFFFVDAPSPGTFRMDGGRATFGAQPGNGAFEAPPGSYASESTEAPGPQQTPEPESAAESQDAIDVEFRRID
ncbi:MAG: FxsA family protein [Sumerlaeia bacterium]